VRILVLIWVIQPGLVALFLPRFLILAAIGAALCFTLRTGQPKVVGETVEPTRNPFEIRPALLFAALFVLASVVMVMVTRLYGNVGLLVLAGAVGVTDIDPFILSLISRTADLQTMLLTAVLVAMMSNTMVKGIYFGFLAKQARTATLWRYGLWAALHIPVILIG